MESEIDKQISKRTESAHDERRSPMKHRVYCYECDRHVTIEDAGDLGQYADTLLECPCKNAYLTPRPIDGQWVLVALADLDPSPAVFRKIIRH